MNWAQTISHHAVEQPLVMVTIARVRGSAPREVGAKMLVFEDHNTGSIGGGQLEYQCQQIAAELLTKDGAARLIRNFALGSQCGQCCGGAVDVLFERIDQQPLEWLTCLTEHLVNSPLAFRITPTRPLGKTQIVTPLTDPEVFNQAQKLCNPETLAAFGHLTLNQHSLPVLIECIQPTPPQLAIFGAGHVGQAIATLCKPLGWHIFLIDPRAEQFATIDNVEKVHTQMPAQFAKHLPAHCWALVMTHDHELDFEISCELLNRTDLNFVGLIGSAAKRGRFLRRFQQAGISQVALDQLTCPIGISSIPGKQPQEIAVAVAAQLLTLPAQTQQISGSTTLMHKDTARAALPH